MNEELFIKPERDWLNNIVPKRINSSTNDVQHNMTLRPYIPVAGVERIMSVSYQQLSSLIM